MHISSTYDTFDSACACVRMPLCVCVSTHTHSVVLHVHTNVTCLYDMHYRERDAHAPCIYKCAHIHATHAHIHVRACPYPHAPCIYKCAHIHAEHAHIFMYEHARTVVLSAASAPSDSSFATALSSPSPTQKNSAEQFLSPPCGSTYTHVSVPLPTLL